MVIILFFVLHFVLALSEQKKTDVIQFEDFDSDGDGKITYAEFARWHKVLNADLNDQKLKNMFRSYDKNFDSTLSIHEFVPLAYSLARKPTGQADELFHKIDVNGDGVITRDEAKLSEKVVSGGVVDGIFEIADRNHDNKLTLDEFQSVFESNFIYGQPKSQEEKNKELAQRLMALIDQNNDRRLNVQEVHSFANMNAKVSEEEVNEAFVFLDTNRNGWLEIGEMIRLPERMAELVRFQEAPSVTN